MAWVDKRVHAFPKSIGPSLNVIMRREIELAYYNVAVQHFCHYITGTPPLEEQVMFTYIHSYVHICMRIYIYACVRVCVRVFVCVSVHMCVSFCVCVSVWVSVCVRERKREYRFLWLSVLVCLVTPVANRVLIFGFLFINPLIYF